MSIQLTSFFPHKKKTRAQGMVEFALVIPIFLVLVLGVLEMGRLLFVYSAVFSASREAARYGAAVGIGPNGKPYFQDCAGMRDAAKRIGSLAGLQDGDITITYDNPDLDPTNPDDTARAIFGGLTCNELASPPTPKADQITLGDRVIVQINITYEPIVGFLGLPDFNIHSASRRTIVRELKFDGPTPLPSLTVGAETASAMTATANAITATASFNQTATAFAKTATAAFQQTGTASVLTATAAYNQTATATAITATAAFEQTGTAEAITATAAYEQTLTAMPTATPTPTATSTATATATSTATPTPTPPATCPDPAPFSITEGETSFTITIDNSDRASSIRIDQIRVAWEGAGITLHQIETRIGEGLPTVVWREIAYTNPAMITTWLDSDASSRSLAPGEVMEITFTFTGPFTITDPALWGVDVTFSNKCWKTWTLEDGTNG